MAVMKETQPFISTSQSSEDSIVDDSPTPGAKSEDKTAVQNTLTSIPSYSVKPIAYVFPQFYPFAENDKIWGPNFTEWNNVNLTTHNAWELETVRPSESIGYYNGLKFATRQRQGKFLKDSGLHGAVYHHYWFAGKPVMDHIIQAMLEDGEPNTPFMLNWANKPWTARWDDVDAGEIFIAQDYGAIDDWRKHFEWLLPFFKHPQYIRSEGRVQFMVYSPQHVRDLGPHMFAAWKQWAVDEGLGGLDVIETRWQGDKWNQGVPDAMNEFQPHRAGFDPANHATSNRIARVYHRGTLVCWDATPRKGKAGDSNCQAFCHPSSWRLHILRMLHKIKEDPNPIGNENFFFVNALNEWGEGNVLEPTVQYGDLYGKAMRKAVDMSEKIHMWPDQKLEKTLNRVLDSKKPDQLVLDVCVLVRTSERHGVGAIFDLPGMLRSLQAQENERWRAIVFDAVKPVPGIAEMVHRVGDPRIEVITVPSEESKHRNSAADWIVKQLNQSDPMSCGTANYLLITDGDKMYEPHTFNLAHQDSDLIGMNLETQLSAWEIKNKAHISSEQRCSRFENTTGICDSTHMDAASLDLSATLIHTEKFLNTSLSVVEFAKLAAVGGSLAWDRVESQDSACHVFDNPAYTACIRTGAFWFDSPVFAETAAILGRNFKEPTTNV